MTQYSYQAPGDRVRWGEGPGKVVVIQRMKGAAPRELG